MDSPSFTIFDLSLKSSNDFYRDISNESNLESNETPSLVETFLDMSLKDTETSNIFDTNYEHEKSENFFTPETTPFKAQPSNIISPIERQELKIPDTLVILHESCVKHEFERNKRDLKYIVERPRRYRAAIIGLYISHLKYILISNIGALSAKAHLDMELEFNSFNIYQSTRLIPIINNPVIEFVHGENWPLELYKLCKNAHKAITEGETEIPGDKYHTGDLYLGHTSLEAFEGCLGAIYDGIDRCLAQSSNVKNVHVLLRPPGHHCSRETPSGFCLLNNALIAISYAHKTYGITHFAILDFDLHHGDGSQEISWRINQETDLNLNIGYFSLHDIYSFPCEGPFSTVQSKIKDASICIMNHNQAIWNIHIEKYDTIEEFEKIYNNSYIKLLTKADDFFKNSNALPEQCLLVISAGFDGSEFESEHMQRHGYHLPTLFYWKFSKDALSLSKKRCCSRIFSIMEGGYSDRAIASGTFALLCGLTNVNEKDIDMCEFLWKMEHFSCIDKAISKGTVSRLPKTFLHDKQINWIKNIIKMAQQYTSILNPKNSLIITSEDKMTLRERKKPVDSTIITSLIDRIEKIELDKTIKLPLIKNEHI
ncbi:uncharacterized protein T551_01088 [Pneumocystis jirovecii RU7]|uniref:Histone deacetylase domain-containing protein n=1 Tax=Pneumocystis jirovecii (strain RU7) TaxID=1408657 RepID=A0A0W4ZU14_PNEJ7|nr:uncharacterized protein T551_01088 [Pneumocystis jirovecii RU7]KTW31827.1 hypothetical protein T551_01088 [Pneumocystis jirovecii RU7]